MKKELEFLKLIENTYPLSGQFEKIRNQLINCRNIMLRNSVFIKLSAKQQFDLCCIICIIASQTSRHDLSMINKSGTEYTDNLEYSIYNCISNVKTLNNENRSKNRLKMKNMKLGKNVTKIYTRGKTISEHEKDLRLQAIELAKKHQDSKPIKYDLKR